MTSGPDEPSVGDDDFSDPGTTDSTSDTNVDPVQTGEVTVPTSSNGGGSTDPVRRVEAGLENAGQTLQREFLGPLGDTASDAVETASPAGEIEESLTGTDTIETFRDSAIQGGVQAANIPAFAADGVRAADIAVRGPDRELGAEDIAPGADALAAGAAGQTQSDLPETRGQFAADAASSTAARTAGSFESDPVATSGQLTGAVIGGAALGSAAARVSRGVVSSAGSNAPIGGTGPLGSGGRGSLFDAGAVDEAQGVSSPGLVQRTLGDLRRDTPDVRTRVEDAESAQLGITRPRSVEPEINDERLSPNLRQQTVTRRQRELDDATEGGTFEGEPQPFADRSLRDRRQADVDRIARQQTGRDADLGDLSRVNDPSGIGAFGGVVGQEENTQAGFGSGSGLGTLSAANDIGGVAVGSGAESGSDTGIDTGSDVGVGSDTDTATDTTPLTTVRADARTGSRTAPQSGGGESVTTSTADSEVETPRLGRGGRGVRPPSGPPRRPDIEDGDDPDDDEEVGFGLAASDDLFDSGITSGREALAESFNVEDGSGSQFSL